MGFEPTIRAFQQSFERTPAGQAPQACAFDLAWQPPRETKRVAMVEPFAALFIFSAPVPCVSVYLPRLRAYCIRCYLKSNRYNHESYYICKSEGWSGGIIDSSKPTRKSVTSGKGIWTYCMRTADANIFDLRYCVENGYTNMRLTGHSGEVGLFTTLWALHTTQKEGVVFRACFFLLSYCPSFQFAFPVM